MKIGLIGAMQEEILLFKKDINNLTVERKGSRNFYLGTIGANEVVMCLSGWGKVAASSTATSLVNLYNVDRLLFIGLAGSMQNSLEIGDIVIADRLVQHDVDLSLLQGYEGIKSPFWLDFSFSVPEKLVEDAKVVCETFCQRLADGHYPEIDGGYQPNIFVGTVGTGDQFVASSESKRQIGEKIPDILCTEMEGAAIAQVGADYDIPCMVIRIISDKADEKANHAFSKFLFEHISQISVEIAKLMFE
ncbi:5'-methylthioadenosine/adenosylhomocysteine nucleosidase [Sunxiuqinia sp. A32]|uniref:5'-methylthioadenosine/adenosylhomocysteine nucleosidase n=1 Tax=Sunxiuqinia sp. A32 TaxID=3461496 RepID=UPI0040455B00